MLFGAKIDAISKKQKKKVFAEILTVLFSTGLSMAFSHAFLMGLPLLNVIWMGPLASSWAP